MLEESDQEVVEQAKEWLTRLTNKPRYRSPGNVVKVLELATEAINLLEDEVAYLRTVADGCASSHDQLEQNNTRLMAVCDMVIADRHGHA